MGSLVYTDLHESVIRVEAKVEDVQTRMISAAKDGGAIQVLLGEAPDLRRTIQETHDAVLKHEARFDALDRTLLITHEGIADIRARLAALESGTSRKDVQPK